MRISSIEKLTPSVGDGGYPFFVLLECRHRQVLWS